MIGLGKRLIKVWTLLESVKKSLDKIKKKTRQNSRDITDLQNNNKLLMQHVHWLAEENKKLSDRVLESERRDYNWAMKNSTGDIILPESVPGTVQKRISNKRPR